MLTFYSSALFSIQSDFLVSRNTLLLKFCCSKTSKVTTKNKLFCQPTLGCFWDIWKIKFICRLLYRIPRNWNTPRSRLEYAFFQSVTYDCIIIFGLDGLLFVIKSVFYNQATVQMLNFSLSLIFWKPVITKDNTLNFVKYTPHTKMLHVKSTIINWFCISHNEWCVLREAFPDKCNEFGLLFGAGKICNPTGP
jgi:hypothetical protein